MSTPPPAGGGPSDPRTHRLRAERPDPEAHLDFAIALYGDPRVAGSLFPDHLGGPRTASGARELLLDQIERWRRDGFGLWWWRERAGGELVARGGLQRTVVATREEVELGWAVAPDRWGEGIATELARASIRVAFTELGLDNLVSFTLTTNCASRRVMENAGLRFERRIEQAGLPHVLYRLSATDAVPAPAS